MTRREIFNLYNNIQKVRYHNDNSKFNYSIIKNIKLIEEQIRIVDNVIKPTQEFIEFERIRIPICEEHAKKDENGRPILINDDYQFEDELKFIEAIKPLQEKYQSALDHRQTQINDYNRLLDEEITINLLKIGKDELPEKITQAELESIFPILA
jgi:hypothetical protein